MGKRNKVTTRDIAEYTGVSQSSVSMILSNKQNVSFSDETRELVLSAAKKLGYQKPVKKQLNASSKMDKTIVVLTPLLSNGYYATLVHSITEQAGEYGYSVFTVTIMRDAAQEEFYFDMLAGLQLAGAICLYPPTRITKANALAKQIPVVSIGDKPEGCTFDSVELDGRKTGYLMGEYLVGLGHTHITFVSTPIKAKEISRLHRLEGLKAAFEEHGQSQDNILVKTPSIATYRQYPSESSEYMTGFDLALEALKEHTPSTAFVGNNDMTAFGVMAALTQQGYRIPQDYSVAGFDNIHLSSMPNISLTSVEHASILKGKEAVDMIYKKNNKDTRSRGHKYILRLEYEPELIIRKSTGKCRNRSR